MRELILLGTGSAMVTHCFNTCFLIRMENGEYFLTDAGGGNGILRQMELVRVDYACLHHMFVTHGHTDHVLGVLWIIRQIAALMNQGMYAGDFHIYGHDVVLHMLDVMTQLTLKKKDLAQIGRRILLHEIKDGQKVSFLGMTLTAFDIQSTKAKQFGYQLYFLDGMKLTCLGDEPYHEHSRIYAEHSDWLLAEAFCQYRDRERFKPYEKHHTTVREACETAASLGAANLVLYHTEDKDMAGRKANYTEEAAQYFQGNVFVPNDLDIISLG